MQTNITMDYKSIQTLADLQKAKSTLREELNVSRHELLRTLEMTRSRGTRLFWRGLALPAGLLGLGAIGMRVARNSFDNQAEKGVQTLDLNEPDQYGNTDTNTDTGGGKWYMELIPIAINLFQMFMANRKNNNDIYQGSEEDAEDYYQEDATYPMQEAMSTQPSRMH